MIALPAEVTFATAPRVLDEAVEAAGAELAPGAAALDVDLAACDQFDSSLLAVALELTRRAAVIGAPCRLHHAPSNLRKLAALYGVDELLFGST